MTATITGKPDPNDELSLLINGMAYRGWTAISVTRGIERIPSSFQLKVTEKYPGSTLLVVPIKPGDACVVKLGNDVVLTGYVDVVAPQISAREHAITVIGRGKCADLVDCSAEAPSGNFQITLASLTSLIEALVAPYSGGTIKVKALDGDGTAPPIIQVLATETPWDIIDRVAKYAALLVYEDADGNIVTGQVGKTKHSSGVAQGVNIEDASYTLDYSQRFSEYHALIYAFDQWSTAQLPNGATPTVVKDPGISRHRMRAIVSDMATASGNVADLLANWSKNRSVGRSQIFRCRIDSWRDSAGKLWEPNHLIPVDAIALGAKNLTYVVAEVEYTRDESGTHANLTLMNTSAFTVEPSTQYAFNIDQQQAVDEANRRDMGNTRPTGPS